MQSALTESRLLSRCHDEEIADRHFFSDDALTFHFKFLKLYGSSNCEALLWTTLPDLYQTTKSIKVLSIIIISIYTLSDLGVSSNLIGSLSLANEHYSPPTE